MGDFTDRDLEKVVVVVRNLDGSFSLPAPGGGTGSDVNVTNAQIAVTGPLTDAQLRATAVPVSFSGQSVSVSNFPATQPVSGTFWQATQPVSGPLTDTQLRATAVPVSGPLTDTQLRASALPVSIAATVATREATNATSSVTQVASSATNVTLKASNASRRGLSVHNDSTAILFLKLGATASATSYTVKMAANAHYEVPFNYTGVVDGIWASANGNAYVTEIT